MLAGQPGYLAIWLPFGCLAARVPGCLATWLCGCMATWLRGRVTACRHWRLPCTEASETRLHIASPQHYKSGELESFEVLMQ